MSAATWIASSRVGTRTRAPGRAFEPAVRSTIGTPKASVLPEPGRRLGENVEAGERVREDEPLDGEWLVIPLSASARLTGALTPSSWNDCDTCSTP